MGFEVEAQHYTVFLEELIGAGKLQIQPKSFACTYHDSCYLGRHNDIYQAPRSLVKAAGGAIVEMEKCEAEAFCCSAGGGRILAEEKLGERMNVHRIRMAEKTGTNLIVSNCPFCLTMFEDGVKGAGIEDSLRPKDIAEILAERLVSDKQ